ncbi:MAG: DMT family transporter [Paracoccaceae bacterium]
MTLAAIDPTAAHRQGVVFVFAAGVLWSTIALSIRMLDDAVVWQILLYRSIGLAAFLFFVIRWRSGVSPFTLARRAGKPAIVGALALILAYGGAIYALQVTSVASAVLLFATSPILAAILGRVFLGERIRRGTWIASAVVLVGIGVMVSDSTGQVDPRGSLAALGSALGFAVFSVALRWGKTQDMLPAVFLSGIFAIVLTVVICVAMGLPLILGARDAGITLGMGVYQLGLGMILYTVGSRSLPAAELTLLSLAEVLLGPLWVYLFLGEAATTTTLIGGAILLVAIAGNAITGTRLRLRAGT